MENVLCQLTASEALARLRAGSLSSVAFAEACLDQIAARDAHVKAWTFVDRDLVLNEARKLDRNRIKGPLHGLPIGIKDVILTHEMPTQYNSPVYQGFHPKLDAACITQLRAAGALIFGKTDTTEFAATGRPALTHNPHDLNRTPGGSSSGSAAAVADFHVPLAIGTQTGGSIIRPASYCGVYGMKPTWNLVSTEGAKKFASSLDTIGWFARTAADLELLYNVFDASDEAILKLNIANAKIAICRTPFWVSAETATQNALMSAAKLLRDAGASVIDVELPSPFEKLVDLQKLIMRSEGGSAFLAEYRTHPSELHPDIRAQVENADGYTRKDLLTAYDIAASCRAIFDAMAADFDVVLTPSAVGEAPLGLASTGAYTFNAMWTLLHVPVINIPGFTGPNGMPVGLSATGPRFSDRRVMAAAEAFGKIFATK